MILMSNLSLIQVHWMWKKSCWISCYTVLILLCIRIQIIDESWLTSSIWTLVSRSKELKKFYSSNEDYNSVVLDTLLQRIIPLPYIWLGQYDSLGEGLWLLSTDWRYSPRENCKMSSKGSIQQGKEQSFMNRMLSIWQ